MSHHRRGIKSDLFPVMLKFLVRWIIGYFWNWCHYRFLKPVIIFYTLVVPRHFNPFNQLAYKICDVNRSSSMYIFENWAEIHIVHMLFSVTTIVFAALMIFILLSLNFQTSVWLENVIKTAKSTLCQSTKFVTLKSQIHHYWVLTHLICKCSGIKNTLYILICNLLIVKAVYLFCQN